MAPRVTRDASLSRPQLCLLSHAQMDNPLLHSHNPQFRANVPRPTRYSLSSSMAPGRAVSHSGQGTAPLDDCNTQVWRSEPPGSSSSQGGSN